MKVVLFCGGLGMRLRDYAENVPKPLVKIGRRPILWHLMKYYSHFGHNEFILCLGYKGEFIKHFFLNYEESVSNDFVLSDGGDDIELLSKDIEDWRITFADTGRMSSIGERLVRVRKYLGDDEVFLANYADGLTDLYLPDMIDHFERHERVGSFLCVKPHLSYHYVEHDEDGVVRGLHPFRESEMRVNGGFMIFRREIFDYMEKGDDLVEPTFDRLIDDEELLAYDYDGFWQAVDTAKDKARVDELHATGRPPWAVWDPEASDRSPAGTDAGGRTEERTPPLRRARGRRVAKPEGQPRERSAVTPVSDTPHGDVD
jgi:glucose-1-phosphate cytidylyltransferase